MPVSSSSAEASAASDDIEASQPRNTRKHETHEKEIHIEYVFFVSFVLQVFSRSRVFRGLQVMG
jgi:hypothetical protein